MIWRISALSLLMVVSGCIKPEITVCGQPGSCVIHVCEVGNTCQAKPLELKGPIP